MTKRKQEEFIIAMSLQAARAAKRKFKGARGRSVDDISLRDIMISA